MDNGTDSLLDTYLFETNSLLDQLDELLIDAEQNKSFTEDEVNEIFRSMQGFFRYAGIQLSDGDRPPH